jgi:hypothetical protein
LWEWGQTKTSLPFYIIMRRLFTAITLSLIINSAFSQKLSQVTISGGTTFSYFSFLTDQGILLRVTDEGKLSEWGTELLSDRGNYYDPKLQPYLGRIEYYGQEADSAFRGKVRSIGTCNFTYYGHLDEVTRVGKLKSIGTLLLDYYSNFDNAAYRGKLRFIGSSVIEYYSLVDDEAYRGKLKSIGGNSITWYSTFDDKMLKGKLKRVGSVPFEWYSSFDRTELRGALKSGLYRQTIGGVTYTDF